MFRKQPVPCPNPVHSFVIHRQSRTHLILVYSCTNRAEKEYRILEKNTMRKEKLHGEVIMVIQNKKQLHVVIMLCSFVVDKAVQYLSVTG